MRGITAPAINTWCANEASGNSIQQAQADAPIVSDIISVWCRYLQENLTAQQKQQLLFYNSTGVTTLLKAQAIKLYFMCVMQGAKASPTDRVLSFVAKR